MNGRSELKAKTIPLVALGASAGGLDPLEKFFDVAPIDAGWCFVVIQHLSPDYRSMMKNILERRSDLRVEHVADGVKIEANTIYLNKPSESVTLEGDTFRTQPYVDPATLPRLPIDHFLMSISRRAPNRTVAVILSGSGSDGTKGAAAMFAAGSAIFVQSPDEADFASMPQSVIKSGTVNRIMAAAEMPTAIRDYFEADGQLRPQTDTASDEMPEAIKALLKSHTGLDFHAYKPDLVQRRIERRQELHGFQTVNEYHQLLSANPAAVDELYQDLLIGVTQFYRNPEAIAALRENVLNKLVAEKKDDTPIRLWVPACASGEEAYTIAIELSEAIKAAESPCRFRIIATDVHRRSIDRASAGVYSEEAFAKMPLDLRDRYFTRHRDHYVVDPALRQKLIFSVHDALSDPPFMHLDMISCRNLLIYLNAEPRARIISMFLFGLHKGGFLFLGPSETLGTYGDEFTSINGRWRIFQKTEHRESGRRIHIGNGQSFAARRNDDAAGTVKIPSTSRSSGHSAEPRSKELLIRSYSALLKRYAPSSILISADGRVLNWFGAASAFIDTFNNLAEWTIEDIVHPSLHFSINVGLEKLRRNGLESYKRKVKVDIDPQRVQWCDLTIEPLEQQQSPQFLLISVKLSDGPSVATETDEPPELSIDDDATFLSRRIIELERDLRLTEETLQQVTERLEASGEELQASNEELQASNEELQASNEELQSSNEELQAVNDELISVSAEHEEKIEELSDLNANTDLVLNTLKVGVIYLDRTGHIRRYSGLMHRRFHLQPHDIGRTLDVVGPRFDFVNLKKLSDETLTHGTPGHAEGEHDGMRLEIESKPIQVNEQDTTKTGAALIIKGLS